MIAEPTMDDQIKDALSEYDENEFENFDNIDDYDF